MKISLLFNKDEIIGDDKEVCDISFRVEDVKKGSLFFCLNNIHCEEVSKKALFSGAVAVVCEEDIDYLCTKIIVSDCRKALSEVSAKFYGYNNELKIIGVVGTNGKTSTCKMLASILSSAGQNVGTICTHLAEFKDFVCKTDMTTPDPPQLFEILSKMTKKGAKYVVMEVSAHAIYFKKCSAIRFSYLIFTNCSQDHLDFFKDYNYYKEVKKSIFLTNNADKMVINSDDECGVEILQTTNAITYGLTNPADLFAINIKESVSNTEFIINAFDDVQKVKLSTIGIFNIYNFLASVAVAINEKIDMSSILNTAKNLPQINGRCELIAKYKGGFIYIDYAHTPEGLNNLLNSFKRVCNGRLICLFGCGGNRDKDKRRKMGEIAGKNCDFIVITSDNPRYEEPYQIIEQIEGGVRQFTRKYITIQNRKSAIEYALEMLGKNDVLLLAGKGDEEYQEIMGTKHNYSDKSAVAEIIGKYV